MSKMSNLYISIQEDLEDGKLTFAEIARKHEVPTEWVQEVVDAMRHDHYITENELEYWTGVIQADDGIL
jgi:phytoene/squalene synthetase